MIREEENRQQYQRMMNKRIIPIRFSSKENGVLTNIMAREGWTSVSRFIKFKAFNGNFEEEFESQITGRDPSEIGTILLKSVLELTDYYMYIKYRYDKDMNQLYREEGVNVDKWRRATNKWYSELTKKTEQHLTLVREIAEALGIDSYFDFPSNHMNIDPDTATTEQMDELARQLRKERVAMGHNVDDE